MFLFGPSIYWMAFPLRGGQFAFISPQFRCWYLEKHSQKSEITSICILWPNQYLHISEALLYQLSSLGLCASRLVLMVLALTALFQGFPTSGSFLFLCTFGLVSGLPLLSSSFSFLPDLLMLSRMSLGKNVGNLATRTCFVFSTLIKDSSLPSVVLKVKACVTLLLLLCWDFEKRLSLM